MQPMYKTPDQIARSLRAFRNAHRLGLVRYVSILPAQVAFERPGQKFLPGEAGIQ